MIATFEIAGRPVGSGTKPLIVAELSANHNGSLERALAIVDAAADAGADAIKLQTYTADTMTLDVGADEFVVGDAFIWKGRTLYELYAEAATPWEWHAPLFRRAAERGMFAFSSPFDETAVAFLETLDVPCYKIASPENGDLPLLRAVAKTGKPVIISTGTAYLAEVDEAIRELRAGGTPSIVILKCTSSYPAPPEESNLRTIPHLRETFGLPVGLSDHTPGIGVAVAAVALGAVLIEKHFTLDRAGGGVDDSFSMEPVELRALVDETARAYAALGRVRYDPTPAELPTRRFRRSLYVGADMAPGERFDTRTLRVVRPGLGIEPRYFDLVLGRKVARAVRKGTPVTWDLLEAEG